MLVCWLNELLICFDVYFLPFLSCLLVSAPREEGFDSLLLVQNFELAPSPPFFFFFFFFLLFLSCEKKG